jgi:hypothetical protein
VKKGTATGPPPDLIEVAFADEIPPEVCRRSPSRFGEH